MIMYKNVTLIENSEIAGSEAITVCLKDEDCKGQHKPLREQPNPNPKTKIVKGSTNHSGNNIVS
jgi:hypothetical protein